MTDFSGGTACTKCGGTKFEPLVQYGSFILRCTSCREFGPASSWLSVGPRLSGTVNAFRDGEEDLPPLAQGLAVDVWQRIRDLASDGTAIVLR